MRTLLLPLITLLVNFHVFCQQPTQIVRGKIYDSETHFPLTGARIDILTEDSTVLLRTKSVESGLFEIKNVPVGKHELIVKMIGYDLKSTTIEVNSGKETILEIALQETILEQEEVVITARKKGEVINELALISAQQFSVSETDRYPGSRSDPARMVSNFAGVGGSDDSRNDIVVRGNSPLGVVWKVEGIDMPNPNHFAISGSSGGPVSIINNKILGNSDFFMSAFPAEYGNSTSGIFDLKLRNGNNKSHEFTGQFGFLGTELMAEGPMGKSNRSSYLMMGRYSTLSLFQVLGIQIGTDAIPVYGDGAFKFNWALKNGGSMSVFGIGGASKIDIVISDQTNYTEELYGEGDRDQYFGTAMGIVGLNYKKPINEKTFITTSLAATYDNQHAHHDYLIRSIDANNKITVDTMYPLMGYDYTTNKGAFYFSMNHKTNKKNLVKYGLSLDAFLFDMIDSVLTLDHSAFYKRWDYEGGAALIQPFVQWKYRPTDKMTFTAGLHAQYFTLSNSLSPAEPRLGWKLLMNNNQSIFAGAGLHSQTQPYYTYLYQLFDSTGNKVLHNKNMDFTKSVHTGMGYEKSFKKKMVFRSEAYYQYLYNVPVTVEPSSFSLINMGSGFARFFPDSLENTGTGYNYGLEVTLQKYFDKSFFFLFSATVFDSKYYGSDGILRNTSYNGQYVANFLAGKEFKVGERQKISIGTKVTTAGGKRYGYVDMTETELRNEIVYQDSAFNDRQFKPYFRMDLKINWKLNTKKLTHEIGLDLVNIFNTKNLLSLAYAPNLADPTAEPIAEKQQLGFLPIFYYKIDFRFEGKKE